MKPKILAVCGTRPDAIKMAPVVLELQKHADIETILVASGQHKEMLEQVLEVFDLRANANFDVMRHGQSLAYLTSAVLEGLDKAIEEAEPQLVIAQGDTTTTLAAGMAAFYRRTPFAHVEAGLRTETVDSPFPEEFNRRAVSLITRLHFAPTELAAKNLIEEGIPSSRVFVTGNTSIDAILHTSARLGPVEPFASGRMLLVTTHRRENWGEPQARICRALKRLLRDIQDIHVVLPMHKNPKVRETIETELRDTDRVFLIEPPDYSRFAQLMKAAHFVLTDSGGVQEEAPSLGKPVLVLRSETERPEGIDAGSAILVGTDEDRIFEESRILLADENRYMAMAQARNPYGDGHASERIVGEIRKFLELD